MVAFTVVFPLMKPSGNDLRYFAYTRKSTEGVERQALSIQAQVAKVQEQFPDITIIETIEESASAHKPGNRPKFAEMIRRIEAGEADGIVAWHPDRLSRNEVEAAQITWMIRQNIIRGLRFCSFSYDPTPEGLMWLQLTMSQSQYFSSKLSRDVKRGYEQKLKLGQKPGCAPEGYRNRLEDHTIQISEPQFGLLRKGFELVLAGHNPLAVLDTLNNDLGYRRIQKRNSGGNELGRSVWYYILRSKFYCGYFRHNGMWYPGSHQRMITEEEYNLIQDLLGTKEPPTEPSKQFAFIHMLKCGSCGCTITVEEKRKITKGGNTHIWRYYRCTRRSKIRVCTERGCTREEVLDQMIADKIAEYTITPETRDYILAALRQINASETFERGEQYQANHKQLEAAQRRVDSLIDMKADGLLDDEDYTRRRDAAKAEITQLRKENRAIEAGADAWFSTAEQILNFATQAHVRFANGSIPMKRLISETLGANLTLKDGLVQLEAHSWFKPVAELAKMAGTKNGPVRTHDLLADSDDDTRLHEANNLLAGVAGLEPATYGFGDRRSTN